MRTRRFQNLGERGVLVQRVASVLYALLPSVRGVYTDTSCLGANANNAYFDPGYMGGPSH